MSIEILPAGDALGAEVTGVDLSGPIDGDVAALLRRAWLDYLVLVFRGQNIDQHRQLALAHDVVSARRV